MQYFATQWKLVALREIPIANLPIADNHDFCAQYWRENIATSPDFSEERESLYVLHLNARKRVTGFNLVAHGTLDTILADARSVFRNAIVANASAIILMHNHPSGESAPSQADINVTRDLIRAGQLLKIEVVDHVIIGQGNHVSLKE